MQQVPITEYTDLYQGLTETEVQQRVKQGKTNKLKKVVGKSYLHNLILQRTCHQL